VSFPPGEEENEAVLLTLVKKAFNSEAFTGGQLA